ncbi:MAG: hypothetical protein WKF82_03830 [Nocardioidaceae bacterium]
MTNDLHFHIPLGFSGTMTVSNDGHITLTSTAPPPAAPSAWPTLDPGVGEAIEDMLKRQKDHDPTTRSLDIATVLVERGWQASVNLKGAYILFEYAGKEHAVSLYLELQGPQQRQALAARLHAEPAGRRRAQAGRPPPDQRQRLRPGPRQHRRHREVGRRLEDRPPVAPMLNRVRAIGASRRHRGRVPSNRPDSHHRRSVSWPQKGTAGRRLAELTAGGWGHGGAGCSAPQGYSNQAQTRHRTR